MVLELDGTPASAWDELDDVTADGWERAVRARMGDLGVDVEVPPDADWTYAPTAYQRRSAARFEEFSRYERGGLALDLLRLP